MGKKNNQYLKIGKFLSLCLWLIFPLGQLTRLPLEIKGVNFYFHDIIAVFLFLWLLIMILKKKEKIKGGKIGRGFFAFTLIAFISWLVKLNYWGKGKSLIGGLYLGRWLLYGGVYFAVLKLKEKDHSFKVFLLRLLIISSLLAALLGLAQYFFFPDLRWTIVFGWDPHWYRLVGTYLDPGFTGLIYLLGLILIFSFYWEKIFSLKRKNYFLTFSVLVLYSALVLTYARSVYLATIIALISLAFLKRHFRFLILSLLFVSLTFLLVPRRESVGTRLERKDTLLARVENWKQSFVIGKNNPFLGVGFNNYRLAKEKYGWIKPGSFPHSAPGGDSSLLFIWATTGTIGLGAYLYFLWQIKREASLKEKLGPTVIISLIVLLIHSFFNNTLFYPWVIIWWWSLLGVV